MYFTPEQIASTNKAGVEAMLGLAGQQFAAFERLSALNFNAAKAAFEEGLSRTERLHPAPSDVERNPLVAITTRWCYSSPARPSSLAFPMQCDSRRNVGQGVPRASPQRDSGARFRKLKTINPLSDKRYNIF